MIVISDPAAYILSYPITQHFGTPEWQSPFGVHTGMDLAMKVGEEVPAVRDGTVTSAWPHVLPNNDPNWPQGICCIIESPDGERYWYAHLSALYVAVGYPVESGQVIGLSGATGAATGPHLHLERNIHQDVPDGPVWPGNWRPVDPEEELDLASDETVERIAQRTAAVIADTLNAGFNSTLPREIRSAMRGHDPLAVTVPDNGTPIAAGEPIFPTTAK